MALSACQRVFSTTLGVPEKRLPWWGGRALVLGRISSLVWLEFIRQMMGKTKERVFASPRVLWWRKSQTGRWDSPVYRMGLRIEHRLDLEVWERVWHEVATIEDPETFAAGASVGEDWKENLW